MPGTKGTDPNVESESNNEADSGTTEQKQCAIILPTPLSSYKNDSLGRNFLGGWICNLADCLFFSTDFISPSFFL